MKIETKVKNYQHYKLEISKPLNGIEYVEKVYKYKDLIDTYNGSKVSFFLKI